MASRWLLCQRSIRAVSSYGRQAKCVRAFSSESSGDETAVIVPRYSVVTLDNVPPMTKEEKNALEMRFAHDFTGTEGKIKI